MSDSEDKNYSSDNSSENIGTAENLAELNGAAKKGVVKWFNDAKGFGFIEKEDGQDVFVHFSSIETPGFKTLNDGEVVEYELKQGDKGLYAAKVLRDPATVAATQKRSKKLHQIEPAAQAQDKEAAH